MNDLYSLCKDFGEQSINALQEIFDKSNDGAFLESTKKELQEDLLSIIQLEMSIGLTAWNISPSGDNHIIVTNNKCVLINIYGAKILFSDWLFLEGELAVRNIHWMEYDSLVVFDIYYIVHDESQKCVCHFTNNEDAFTYFTAISKCSVENKVKEENAATDLGFPDEW